MSPFAGYEDVEACVADNQDRDDPEAYCAAIKEQVEALAEDHPRREAGGFAQPNRHLSRGDPGAVRRSENDDGSVTYENLLFLGPGEWTDAASGETIFYAPEMMEALAADPDEHVVDASVNVDHKHQDQLAQVGDFDPSSLTVDGEGNVYGDVTLHGRTTASADAIGLLDLALESEGTRGAGGLSVEIPMEGEVTEWDDDRGMERMVEADLAGLAIVTDAASEPAAFDEQFADRAVAMSAAGDGEGVRVLYPGETDLSGVRHDRDMDPRAALVQRALEAEEAVEITVEGTTIGDIQDALGDDPSEEDIVEHLDAEEEDDDEDDTEQELQEPEALEQTATLLDQFLEAGGDPDAPASEFEAFVASETDADPEEIRGVLDAYLAEAGAESLEETPVADLQGFVDAALEEGGEPGEEDAEREEAADAEEVEALREEKEELSSTVEELERRLEKLEDEPVGARSMRETATGEDGEADDPEPVDVVGGIQREGDYIGQ